MSKRRFTILAAIVLAIVSLSVAGAQNITSTIGQLPTNSMPSPGYFTVVDNGTTHTYKSSLTNIVQAVLGIPVSVFNGGTGVASPNPIATSTGCGTLALSGTWPSKTLSGNFNSCGILPSGATNFLPYYNTASPSPLPSGYNVSLNGTLGAWYQRSTQTFIGVLPTAVPTYDPAHPNNVFQLGAYAPFYGKLNYSAGYNNISSSPDPNERTEYDIMSVNGQNGGKGDFVGYGCQNTNLGAVPSPMPSNPSEFTQSTRSGCGEWLLNADANGTFVDNEFDVNDNGLNAELVGLDVNVTRGFLSTPPFGPAAEAFAAQAENSVFPADSAFSIWGQFSIGLDESGMTSGSAIIASPVGKCWYFHATTGTYLFSNGTVLGNYELCSNTPTASVGGLEEIINDGTNCPNGGNMMFQIHNQISGFDSMSVLCNGQVNVGSLIANNHILSNITAVTCSSSSKMPCNYSAACSLSATATCSTTVTVPSGATCSGKIGGSSDTSTGVGIVRSTTTITTLTLNVTMSNSQTSTVGIQGTCQ